MSERSVQIGIRGGVVRVSTDDEAAVRAKRWRVQRNPSGVPYPVTGSTGKVEALARWLLSPAAGLRVSYRNGDPMDCRRSNLRTCSYADAVRARSRAWGSSPYKGVSRQGKGWVSSLKFEGKKRYLGFFDTQEEAAFAYDAEARKVHGAVAVVNFPGPGEAGVQFR